MKKLIITIACIVALLIATGCTKKQIDYTINAAAINADFNLLVERYDTMKELTTQKWEMFEKEDQDKLKVIDGNVLRIIYKANQLKTANFAETSPAELGYLYTLGEQAYGLSKQVFSKYESQLSSTEVMQVQIFDERVRDLDKQITEMMEDPENTNINYLLVSILTVASTGMKLLLPLLL